MIKVERAEFVKSARLPEDYPAGGLPEFAFFGRSNCGKSSLINMLVNRKGLVKPGSTPGMTRLVNFFAVNGAAALVSEVTFAMSEQSAGSRQALEGLQEIESVTAQIRAGSIEMNAGTEAILNKIIRLSDVSQSVRERSESIAAAAEAINGAVGKIARNSTANSEAISALVNMTRKFKV